MVRWKSDSLPCPAEVFDPSNFNLHPAAKIEEKLTDMHLNAVCAELVQRLSDWLWSSARYY